MSWILNRFLGSSSIHGILKRTQASLHASVIPTEGNLAGTIGSVGHIDRRIEAAGIINGSFLVVPRGLWFEETTPPGAPPGLASGVDWRVQRAT